MFRQLWQFLLFVWLYRATAALGFFGGSSWTYYFEELETETSDEKSMSFDLRYERITPGIYGISGTMNINYDFKEDTTMEASIYRSASGNTDFMLLPYSVPRQDYVSVMNSFYKEILMKSLGNCSNLPYFEDKFEPPFKKKVYELQKCQIATDKMPQNLPEGFYKVVIIGDGEVQWKIEIVFKLEPI